MSEAVQTIQQVQQALQQELIRAGTVIGVDTQAAVAATLRRCVEEASHGEPGARATALVFCLLRSGPHGAIALNILRNVFANVPVFQESNVTVGDVVALILQRLAQTQPQPLGTAPGV